MTIDIFSGVPNLNKQTPNDLETFAESIRTNGNRIAKILFPNKSPDVALLATNKLGDYAASKARQIEAHQLGLLIKADVHDEQQRNILRKIPPFALWETKND